jgi:CDP-glycerol glycerophosphotransferase (TagB/SpsB family)
MSLVGRFPLIGFFLVNLRVIWSVLRVLPQLRKTDISTLNERVILVSDRESAARDNGEAFFRYLQETEEEEQSYFVIARDSPCGIRLAADGFGDALVEPMSLNYWLLMARASAVASSQRDVDVHVRVLRFILRWPIAAKVVFLCHGIQHTSHSDFELFHTYDTYCCSTEFDQRDLFNLYARHGRNAESLKLVGLARFDRYENLESTTRAERVIISPTWRSGRMSILPKRQQLREYIDSWSKLISALSLSDLECILISHPLLSGEISGHAKKLGMEVYEYHDIDFQFALASSTVFVTDFSSTSLEALYAGTSLVLFRPPEDTSFTHSHLAAGLTYNLFEYLGAHVCTSRDCAVDDTLRKAADSKLEGDELALRDRVFATYPEKANHSILQAIRG